MRQQAWVDGMRDLVASFPNRDETEGVREHRGRLYQQHLADLTDEQWAHAVAESIKRDRWFPTIAALREYAEAWRSPALALPPPRMTEAEREEARRQTREGLEMIRRAVGAVDLPLADRTMPDP